MKLRCLVWGKILKTWRPRHQSGVQVREEMLVEPADHSVYIAVESVASAECRPRGRAGRYVVESIQLFSRVPTFVIATFDTLISVLLEVIIECLKFSEHSQSKIRVLHTNRQDVHLLSRSKHPNRT